MQEKYFFKKKDLFIVLLLLLVASGLFLWQRITAAPGAEAVVSIVGQKSETISLSKDGEYKIEAKLPVTLEVKNGKIRFVRSVCPDHLCEGVGWISAEGENATCVPAGVSVTVQP